MESSYVDFEFGFIFVYAATYVFVALCCLVLSLRLNNDIGRDQEIHFFRVMMIALIIYCVVEPMWAVGNFGISTFINRFNIPLSVINHTMIIGICYYWFCFIEANLHSRIVDRVSLRFVSAIPLFIALVLTVSTIWTRLVFFADPNGMAQRGAAYLPVLVIVYGYPVVATVRAIVGGFKTSSKTRRRELFTMATFPIPPALAGIVDAIVPMMPIVAPAFFLSFLFVFTMLQESQISHDALTGLNNRRRADLYFEESLEKASAHNPFYFFVIDGDLFKEINDTYGHLEGDRALCVIASALRDACRNNNAFVARWGGDEFVIMACGQDIGDPEELAFSVQDCLVYERAERGITYDLSVSIGYAICTDPTQTKRQIIDAADTRLYEEKRKSHTQRGAA